MTMYFFLNNATNYNCYAIVAMCFVILKVNFCLEIFNKN